MTRPLLDPISLNEVRPFDPLSVTVTMSIGQWDRFLAMAYEGGYTLLELDDNERPVAAYRKNARHFPA
jgi:hypothetical protein